MAFDDGCAWVDYLFNFLNVLRLTSAPFFHAAWTGIAAYLIRFGARYPKQRLPVLFIAAFVPAVLHASYDFTFSVFPAGAVTVGAISVTLLGVYLGSADAIERLLELERKA